MISSVWNLLKKEFRSFFNTPIGYIILAIFFVGAGLFLWVFPGEYNVLNSGYANIDGLFVLAPWLFLFLCPAVTMRLIAEERQQGTIELLLTRPISACSLVVGKFLSAWLIMVIALIPAIIWYATVYVLAEPMGNVDSGAFWGSFIGLLFLASVYGAIGLFGSSITRNQLTAFVVSAIISFNIFYGFELIGSLFSDGDTTLFIKNIGIHAHYQSMSRGVLDSRDVLYMIIITVLFLLGAKTALTQKNKFLHIKL
ncbi:MAG TPA: gliding motility-associated ABC transporter permease subunit GldF [Paludibacteraceae bacterium]|nr:gliding motility-associated ABC transporter permease subunit GldF [Paludibacteraceae bacterium]